MNTASRAKNRLKIWLSALVLAGIAFGLSSNRGLTAAEIGHAMERFGPFCLAITLACTLFQTWCMILRIWLLSPKGAGIGLFGTAHAISFGQTVNTFFPARAGDVLKTVLMQKASRNQSFSLLTSAGVVLADKAVDLAALLVLIGISGAGLVPRLPLPSLRAWGAGLAAVLVLFLLLRRWWPTKWRPSAERLAQLHQGLRPLRHPRRFLLALLVGIGSWGSEAIALKTLCAFQGIPLGFDRVIFLLCVLNIAIAVPVSLANLGTFEASIVFGLGTFGVAMAQGIAVATVHHSIQLVGILLWAGGIALLGQVFPSRGRARKPAGGALAPYPPGSRLFDET